MSTKKYKCSCDCGDEISFSYYGKMRLDNLNSESNFHKAQLNDLFIFYSSEHASANNENRSMNITYPMEKIPEIIQDLKNLYDEYQEVKKELKKQGKLEGSVEDNKLNLSSNDDLETQNFSQPGCSFC